MGRSTMRDFLLNLKGISQMYEIIDSTEIARARLGRKEAGVSSRINIVFKVAAV